MDYMKKQMELKTKITNIGVLVELLYDLDLMQEDILDKIKQLDIQTHLELKQLELSKGKIEEENIAISKELINEKWLNKELNKDQQFELLLAIRNIFGRKDCKDSGGLKSWLIYLGYKVEYSKEKDKKTNWVTLTIS